MTATLLVFLGGGLGSVCRYWIGLLLAPLAIRFPMATLLSNVLAAIAIAFVLGLLEKGQVGQAPRLLLVTGFCGGLSTFSTFSAETLALLQGGQIALAVLNVVLNLVLCIGVCWVWLR